MEGIPLLEDIDGNGTFDLEEMRQAEIDAASDNYGTSVVNA